MHVDKINNIIFQAGKLNFLNVKPEVFVNVDALEAFAKKENIDISIYRKDGKSYFANYDMYFIKCTKIFRNFFKSGKTTCFNKLGLTIHPKKIVPETLSENVYNVVLETTENIKKGNVGTRIKDKCINLVGNNPLYLATRKIFVG